MIWRSLSEKAWEISIKDKLRKRRRKNMINKIIGPEEKNKRNGGKVKYLNTLCWKISHN